MPLAHDEITTISRDVVRQYSGHPLEFVGVMASEGGSGRVEVMVTVRGCHTQPCQIMLNLSRRDKASLEHELRRGLEQALRKHAKGP